MVEASRQRDTRAAVLANPETVCGACALPVHCVGLWLGAIHQTTEVVKISFPVVPRRSEREVGCARLTSGSSKSRFRLLSSDLVARLQCTLSLFKTLY